MISGNIIRFLLFSKSLQVSFNTKFCKKKSYLACFFGGSLSMPILKIFYNIITNYHGHIYRFPGLPLEILSHSGTLVFMMVSSFPYFLNLLCHILSIISYCLSIILKYANPTRNSYTNEISFVNS